MSFEAKITGNIISITQYDLEKVISATSLNQVTHGKTLL